ncbi:MAG: DUF72 domain-containing protein, partial [Chloroflexaceae bacterium]|nr:DUF72 domain-containing protein [Chloroflexaceae bacterium]
LHPLHSSGFSLVRYIAHPDLPLNDPLLDEWAERLALWLRDGVQVYWFMHCPDESRSPELCRALYRRLARLIDLPPLPWDDIDGARMEQQRLF